MVVLVMGSKEVLGWGPSVERSISDLEAMGGVGSTASHFGESGFWAWLSWCGVGVGFSVSLLFNEVDE